MFMDWIDEAKKQQQAVAKQETGERAAALDAATAAANDHRNFLADNATRLKEVLQDVERLVQRARAADLGLSSTQTCEGHGVMISEHGGAMWNNPRPSNRSIHVTPSRPGFTVEFHYVIRNPNNDGFQVRKAFKLERITEDRILQWLRWLATGEGRPWGWWSYHTRTKDMNLGLQHGGTWGPWRTGAASSESAWKGGCTGSTLGGIAIGLVGCVSCFRDASFQWSAPMSGFNALNGFLYGAIAGALIGAFSGTRLGR